VGGHRLVRAASRLAVGLLALTVVSVAGLLSALPASATTTVNCDTQNLQAKIASAPVGGTLLVKGTCSGNFVIDRDLTLKGNPSATLDGEQAGTTVAVNTPHVVHLVGLSVTGGWSENGVGGGVSVGGGKLFLDHVSVTGNVSTSSSSAQACGGGVRGLGGAAIHVTDSTIVGNIARTTQASPSAAFGGGICTTGQSPLTVVRSTISRNRVSMPAPSGRAHVGGAGIAASDSTVSITSSHVENNIASAFGDPAQIDGAGVWDASFSVPTVLTVKSSTIGGNRAFAHSATGTVHVFGGGLNGDTVTVSGSTLSANRITGSATSGFAQVEGGGVWAGRVTLSGSRVTGSVLRGVGGFSAQAHGGGVWSDQKVTVSSSTISSNSLFASGAGTGPSAGASTLGGGINSGTLAVITGSTVAANVVRTSAAHSLATADGGGIDGSGEVRLTRSTVKGNSVTGSSLGAGFSYGVGGGVEAADATVTSSTVSGNAAAAVSRHNDANSSAGGIFAHGDLHVLRSTISGNSVRATAHESAIATADSAAISPGGTVAVQNSTVAGNSAHAIADPSSGEARAFGGVLFAADSTVTLVASTLVRNGVTAQGSTETASGGGLSGAFSDITMTSSILALNMAAGGPDCGVDMASGGHNLLGTTSGCAFSKKPSDKVNVANPKLGPLADNGGPARTVALLSGSPAVDTIPPAACKVTSDERGVHRPQGPRCDTGAYERKP
jgi:hypothetical protein